MTAKNDITGDALVSKTPTDAYRDGWDAIFGKKKTPLEQLDDYKEKLREETTGVTSLMRGTSDES